MQKRFLERYNSAKQKNAEAGGECRCSQDGSLLSEADTFIEFCFERRCAEMKNGMAVLDEWRYHKSQYCQVISTTVYEFHHYSRHDASHSISILEAMEMLIGEERIVLLSRGDLWLLLEAAYSHDMGMSLTGQELCELWKREEFKEYLFDCVKGNGLSQKKAVYFYMQMNNLLNGRTQMDGISNGDAKVVSFKECWPAKIANYVEWIVADYIRKKHAERMKLARQRIITMSDSQIPSRLYDMVAVISGLHTEEYSQIIQKLEFEAKGIGAETVHPRFAAAMLRLGDVLDIENNRFSMYDLEHELEIPEDSKLHVRKHEAIKHIHISTEQVEIVAEAEELAVCKETSYWFTLVNREVDSIISHWNSMAPQELKGCTLNPSICKVYYRDAVGNITEYAVDQQKYFEVNKQKLIQLLVGTNIYDKKLDFIREYLQNAMDAVKMQIWQDIENGEYEDLIDQQTANISEIMPYDLKDEIYKRNKIRLKVKVPDENYKTVRITIEDSGIGMEKECVKVLSSLGSGWRKRERYTKEIRKMPLWLRPTGGFGIGIQSAFMVAERVVVETQVQGESKGRRITMESPQKSGMVSTEDFYMGHHGTRVSIDVPLENFLGWNQSLKAEAQGTEISFRRIEAKTDSGAELGWDLFSPEYIEQYIREVLKNYLEQISPEPLIPIVMSSDNYDKDELKAKSNECLSNSDKKAYTVTEGDRQYRICFTEKGAIIWDCKECVLFEIEWNPQEYRKDLYTDRRGRVFYKSIRMTKERIPERVLYENFDISINYMGFDAENVLKVHRNEFVETFDKNRYIQHYMKVFVRELRMKEKENSSIVSENISEDERYWLTRIFLEGEEGWIELRKQIEKMCCEKERYVIDKYYILPVKKQGAEEEKDEGDKKEKIESEEIDIKYKKEQVSLLELCERYIKMLRGDVDENEKRMSLYMHKSPRSKKNGGKIEERTEAIAIARICTWVSEHMEYDGTNYNMKAGDTCRDVIYEMIENGIYVNDYFSALLAENHASIKTEFPLNGVVELSPVVCFTRETAQSEEEQMEEVTFFKKMIETDSTIFSYSKGLAQYKELCINELPYDIKVGKKEPYFISPISKKWKKTSKWYEVLKGSYKPELQQFIDDIVNDAEFGFLVSWVAGHVIEEDSVYKNNEEAVTQKYKELLADIYIKVLKNKDKNKDAEKGYEGI